MTIETSVGTSDADSITVMGRDLARDLMGKTTLADHGLTPTVLAARLTHTGAPESIQGAVAAGLLGAGSVFLGVVEDTVRFIDQAGDDVEGAVKRRARRGTPDPGARPPSP